MFSDWTGFGTREKSLNWIRLQIWRAELPCSILVSFNVYWKCVFFYQKATWIATELKIEKVQYVLYLVCVAENRRVCLSEGRFSIIPFIVWAKPMSKILSASSKTVYDTKTFRIMKSKINGFVFLRFKTHIAANKFKMLPAITKCHSSFVFPFLSFFLSFKII